MKLWMSAGLTIALFLSSKLLAQTPAPAAGAPTLLVDGEALVKTWQPPVYPPELKAANVQGDVTVHFVIDETGASHKVHATKSSDPRFEAAAVEAVSKWTFEPAIEDSTRVASGVSVHLVFQLPVPKPGLLPPRGSEPKSLPKIPAVAQTTPDPEYPPALVSRRLNAQVVFDIEIDSTGLVAKSKLLAATHPDFVKPCLESLALWKFKPGHQGDLLIKSTKRVPMAFDVYVPAFEDGVPSQLTANGFSIHATEGTSPTSLCSIPPEIFSLADPVYPADLAVAGKSGEAEASFTVSVEGHPAYITVRSASDPVFGKALVASIEATRFKPALLSGTTVAVPMTRKYVFTAPGDNASNEESVDARLIRLFRAGTAISGPKGLDAKITPLLRIAPTYPLNLRGEGNKGTAEIEGIIDGQGRVRALRIASASKEEFGWAAATAFSQWIFEAPKRNGEAVDVRVRVPFAFSP